MKLYTKTFVHKLLCCLLSIHDSITDIMRKMSNGTRWALFVVFIITIGLVAFKSLESLPTMRRVEQDVHPNSQNYRLITTTKKPQITTPITVAVTKPPKPVIMQFKKSWKKRGDIFYREIKPVRSHKIDVLLLHGRRFTSINWANLKTMDILAAQGYRVVAVDLPGNGNSTYKFSKHSPQDKDRANILANFIGKVGLLSPVIVSPSASGKYSLPYIATESSKRTKALRGFVSIAVEGTDRISGKDFKRFPPTLILRGSKDTSLGVTSANALKFHVPHFREKVIEGAGQACYISKPDTFHEILLTFLQDIVDKNIIN